MDIFHEYPSEFDQAILLGIHKNDKADAYILITYNDYVKAKPMINDIIGLLRFN